MDPTINIHEAKTNLSRIVEEVAAGAEVIIAKAGKPMARLSSIQKKVPIRFGVLKGKVKFSEDFDAPLPEAVLATFEGE